MFSNFSEAIKSRNKEGIKSEFTFIGIKESSVENYEKIKDNLFATVKFVAEVISVKKDINNKIIEVDENAILEDVIKKHFKEKNIVAANVDNVLKDLSDPVIENSNIQLVASTHKDGIEVIRHTCAHIFGHAIKQIYPDVKMVIGSGSQIGSHLNMDPDRQTFKLCQLTEYCKQGGTTGENTRNLNWAYRS